MYWKKQIRIVLVVREVGESSQTDTKWTTQRCWDKKKGEGLDEKEDVQMEITKWKVVLQEVDVGKKKIRKQKGTN